MWIALLLSACLRPEPAAPQGCGDCHGSAASPAPPTALGGATERSDRGVGAHAVHLAGSDLAGPVACNECHVVPATVDAPGHVDTPWPAEVGWGEGVLAKVGAEPFDASAQTCVVYCHGATLGGGPSPVWTSEEGLGCAGCHGFPPAAPHPDSPTCGDCHVTAAGPALDTTLHIDGTVQLSGGTVTDTSDTGLPPVNCVGCHGADDNPAPPPDTQGRSATTLRSVGAHDTHVLGTANAAAVPCAECHAVPVAVDDAGHLNGTVEVVFGPLSRRANHVPTWDPGTATCAETACHARNGTVETPVWTQVDGTQAACGTCHTIPPGSPHPANNDCSRSGCHDSGVVGPGPTILDPSRHVDGNVDF
ncbi:MAG: hypothetical protein H6738_00165 [Alphaproteobacteria bacterium]|nr:hypothetical protein [Alphaproteobacteria bacterium]MCB9695180.1 hypothetical protein [Alphaproteobacteria bacterium]